MPRLSPDRHPFQMLQASRTHENNKWPRLFQLSLFSVCLLIIKHTLYQTHGVYGSANNVIMGIDPGHDPSTRGTGPENPAGSGPGLIL
ncbi:unnamed protein product, partial [Fusarium fujikuroi]